MPKILTLLTAMLLSASSIALAKPAFNKYAIENTNSSSDNAQFYFSEGAKLEQQKKYNDALIYFGRAAFEFANAKMSAKQAESLLRMSDIHRILNNYKVAENIVLNIVLKSYAKLGSKVGEMNAYRQLGKIYLDAGRYTESLWFFTQHGIIAQQIANRHAYIESVLDIARLKSKKKEYNMATADVNRAELLSKNANTSQFESRILEIRKSIKDRS